MSRNGSGPPPATPLEELAGYVAELVDPIRHDAEFSVYSKTGKRRKIKHHRTVQPSLLDQLREQIRDPGKGGYDDGGAGGFESGPPVNSEALALLIRVERGADSWVREVDVRPRATVEWNLRALIGAAPGMDASRLRMLIGEVRGWHTSARIVCDWQAPAWRPRAPCPACGRRNGLRVRLADKTALCVLCRADWTAETIGVLAEHIRAAGEERGASGLTRSP